MRFQVSRTDTGQFVLTDVATDTVVIDDELAAGYDKLERVVADKPRVHAPATTPGTPAPGSGTPSSSVFAFAGGPRYTPVLLAVVLPFAWLAVLYFALANLLSEAALDRGANQDTAAKLEALERELQALRSEVAGAPRAAKTTPSRKQAKAKPKPKPATIAPSATGDGSDPARTPADPEDPDTDEPEGDEAPR